MLSADAFITASRPPLQRDRCAPDPRNGPTVAGDVHDVRVNLRCGAGKLRMHRAARDRFMPAQRPVSKPGPRRRHRTRSRAVAIRAAVAAPAARPRRAWRAAQHARSLLHQCRRRLPGAHRRRRIADRVYDRHRRRGAYLAAPGVVRLRRGTGPGNPPRRAARSSTQMWVLDWAQVRERAFPDLPPDSSVTRPPGDTPRGPAGRRGSRWRGRQRVAGLEEVLRLARSAGQPPVCSVRAGGPRGVD